MKTSASCTKVKVIRKNQLRNEITRVVGKSAIFSSGFDPWFCL